MGYNLKKLTEELKVKGLADDGLVAWGQNVNAMGGFLGGAIGGAIAGATSPMHTISCKGDKIVIIPFSNKEIKYSEGIMIDKSKIKKAKLSFGLWTRKLKIETTDGKSRAFSITQGKSAVKQILAKLGF